MSDRNAFVFDPPERILLGPGPSMVPARVLAALARPTVGYLDASYVALMEAVQPMWRSLFRTRNESTLAITGSGTAAMEAAIVNTIERGDRAVACVHGFFGDRMRQILDRAGADVHVVEAPWGEPTDPRAVEQRLASIGGAKVVTVIHGETSTGVRQELAELARIAHAHGAVVIADAVASLGGVEFETDAWDVDVAYTGAQKCLSVPPGISPITFGPRALEAISKRSTPCQSWYLDLALNMTYWARPHAYHHTGPINLMYALHEGLRIIEEEGLERRIARCERIARGLWAGLEAMGLELLVAPEHRLSSLTTVKTPSGVDEARVRTHLMDRHGIEIAGGLGPLKGRTWRIGLMGTSCVPRNVELLLTALEGALRAQGHPCTPGAASAAAAEHLHASDA
jgi:alanine-glyoxylate transaminase / serine-glyoxylate transaminase / serine-pyruvate transaminase